MDIHGEKARGGGGECGDQECECINLEASLLCLFQSNIQNLSDSGPRFHKSFKIPCAFSAQLESTTDTVFRTPLGEGMKSKP